MKLTIEWKAPARFDQVLELSVYASHHGNTSFTVIAEFRIAGEDKIIATERRSMHARQSSDDDQDSARKISAPLFRTARLTSLPITRAFIRLRRCRRRKGGSTSQRGFSYRVKGHGRSVSYFEFRDAHQRAGRVDLLIWIMD